MSPTTKSGEKITWKQFFTLWKVGIANLTPQQRIKNEYRGTVITLLGFFASLVAVIVMREKIGLLSYGLILIFLGSIITTGLKALGMKQQKKVFDNIEKELGEVDDKQNI